MELTRFQGNVVSLKLHLRRFPETVSNQFLQFPFSNHITEFSVLHSFETAFSGSSGGSSSGSPRHQQSSEKKMKGVHASFVMVIRRCIVDVIREGHGLILALLSAVYSVLSTVGS